MTEAGRMQHITQALRQYNESPHAARETLRIPLRGDSRVLEVVEVPLTLPILNANSFRIAPLLQDHPRAGIVFADPQCPEAQEIVATLVRTSHRYADELKESLISSQDQPGVITRTGKLVNANSRCVLLRELAQEGRISRTSIRVAVLPADVTGSEELELESVLQKQREHKDEYNLVSELMMITKLHQDAWLTDAAIAKRLRIKQGEARVAELRAVLGLMERARHLTTDAIPITNFVSEQDQRQNWLELLRKVRELDASGGTDAGNDHIRRWLIAFSLGQDSVHKLRHASGPWIERDVVKDLSAGDGVAARLAAEAAEVAAASQTKAVPPPTLLGLDLLGEEPEADPDANSTAVQRLLDLAVQSARAGDGDVTLADGTTLPAHEVRDKLSGSVARGLDAVKRRTAAGNRLTRPANVLAHARNDLRDALDALDEIGDDPAFDSQRDNVIGLVNEVATILERITSDLEALNNRESS